MSVKMRNGRSQKGQQSPADTVSPVLWLCRGIQLMLADRVETLMERGDPAVVHQEEALSSGLGAATSAQLELITEVVSQTIAACEVAVQAEHAAILKTHELQRLAENDQTPLALNRLPHSVSELRTMMIDQLIATDPHRSWKHSELMWPAGVKRGSVHALLQKSDFDPAPTPTLVQAPVTGKNTHRAVRGLCRKHGGAPEAWLDLVSF